jgi:hypothetical protein
MGIVLPHRLADICRLFATGLPTWAILKKVQKPGIKSKGYSTRPWVSADNALEAARFARLASRGQYYRTRVGIILAETHGRVL